MRQYSSSELKNHLQKTFGFPDFIKGQLAVIEKILSGNSVAAIFPTGAGKSLCYQLPATLLPGITLVVSPLLSLMYDQLEFLKKHTIPAASLDSTLGRDEYQNVLARAKAGELKVLMISVERFRNERFRSHLLGMNISLLVVDEAHCISEWGHNFRPEYLKLPIYKKEFSIRQILLLTATATTQVADDMCSKLDVEPQNLVRTGFYRKNLFLQVSPVPKHEKPDLLKKRLAGSEKLPTIIYVTLQKTAETVAGELTRSGIAAYPYHAGMENDARADIQNRFMTGSISCVVATIAFGMGIDKSDIRRIIHYDLPKSIEGYSQEIGRSGRDGTEARCELFADQSGITTLENFVYGDTPEKSSLKKLLVEITQSGSRWEVKPITLGNSVNIRQLPLKTALVYLEMEGIISSQYSYFSEYQFKTSLTGKEIVAHFKNEPADFLRKLLTYARPKKVWIDLDLSRFVAETGFDRKRAVTALEYLDGNGLIELSATSAVEVYNVNNHGFDSEILADRLSAIFAEKQQHQIDRIREMVSFFESDECISYKLAGFFGETIEAKKCGHCSVCITGAVKMVHYHEAVSLSSFNIKDLISEFSTVVKNEYSPVLATRFLCGITTPLLTSIKAQKMGSFEILKDYPYAEVLKAVEAV